MALTIIFATYMLASFFKLSANIVMPYFRSLMVFSDSITGLISSSYFLPYTLIQFFVAPLCKKYGSFKVLGSFLLASVASCLFFAFAENPAWVLAGRFLSGIGMAPVYIGMLNYLSEQFDTKHFAIASGIALGCSGIGSICSAAPLNFLLNNFGIRKTYLLFALVLFFLSSTLLVLSRNHKPTESDSAVLSKMKKAFSFTINNKAMLLGVIVWTTYVSIQMTFTGLWCTDWSKNAFPLHLESAALFGTITNIGCTVNSFTSEKLFLKNKTRAQSSFLALIMFCISFIAMISCRYHHLFKLCFAADFLFGFTANHLCLQMTAFSKDFSPNELTSSVLGIWNAFSSLGVLFLQAISGTLLDVFNSFTIVFGLFASVVVLLIYPSFRIWYKQKGTVLQRSLKLGDEESNFNNRSQNPVY